MTLQTVPMPADVQAALDAYLAARVADVTWTAYVNGLGPGVALDVATDLCLWATADVDAAHWIQRAFEFDPTGHDAMPVPPGVLAASRSLDTFLENDPGFGPLRVVLERIPDQVEPWWTGHWTVRLEDDQGDWESEGHVTSTEWNCWRGSVDAPVAVDPWAVAACRATCHSWAPDWAREQAAVSVPG